MRDYTPKNSALVPLVPALAGVNGQFSGSSVKTDGLGNITGYAFWANAPLPPHAVGQKVDYFLTSANTGLGGREGDEIGNQMTCAIAPAEFGNQCASSGYPFTAWFFNETPGKWSSFDPLPDSGQGTAGIAAVVIANVAANDGVNGAPATIGAGGSGLLPLSSSWPAGISLDTSTGAVSISSTVAAGSYALTYQLCDSQSPLACVDVAATVKVLAAAQPARPAQATPVPALGRWQPCSPCSRALPRSR